VAERESRLTSDVREADPSSLTTQQLWREISALEKLLNIEIDAIKTSIKVAHDDLVRVPTDVQKQVGNLKELHEEKFRSIEIQFAERDTRVETTAKDKQDALAAALQAAKELVMQQNTSNALAIAKSETATARQIDQLGVVIQTSVKASDEKFDDLKQRVTRIEGMAVGTKDTKVAQLDSGRYLVAVIGLILAVLAFVVGRGGLR
jgi:hypothetical protein